jgi:hypothetical protein
MTNAMCDDLAEIVNDLEWALVDIRATLVMDCSALQRADAALERLNAIVFELALATATTPCGSSH